MENKFVTNMAKNHSAILRDRAILHGEDALDEQNEIIRELKKEERSLERKIIDLSDVSPNTTTSLQPAGEDFDAKAWARALHKAKVNLELLKAERKIAENVKKEFFTELKTTK